MQDTSIFRDANSNTSDSSAQPFTAYGGNIVSSSSVPTTDVAGGAGAAGPATDPAAAPGSADAVGYGPSTFHVDLTASPGVITNATGVVFFSVNPQENS